jgi:hypothetical protein
MTSKLSEEEREIWRIAYTLHEKYHDRRMTTDRDWEELTEDVKRLYVSEDEMCTLLSCALGVMMLEYFDSVYKHRRFVEERQPKQLTIDLGIGRMIG